MGHGSDDEVWSKVFRSYPNLVRAAKAQGAGDDAEDVASSVMLRVATGGLGPDDISWPYLSRAVRNEVIDRYRRWSREREAEGRIETSFYPQDVEEQALAAIEVGRILEIIKGANPESTASMIVSRVLGMSWHELGQQFGLTASAAQSRVRRALLRAGVAIAAIEKVA